MDSAWARHATCESALKQSIFDRQFPTRLVPESEDIHVVTYHALNVTTQVSQFSSAHQFRTLDHFTEHFKTRIQKWFCPLNL